MNTKRRHLRPGQPVDGKPQRCFFVYAVQYVWLKSSHREEDVSCPVATYQYVLLIDWQTDEQGEINRGDSDWDIRVLDREALDLDKSRGRCALMHSM